MAGTVAKGHFAPFAYGALRLSNRIVMAPMTRYCSPGGVPGRDVADYYRRRAENAVGLIVTEGTVIDHPASTDNERAPRFFGDDALEGWRVVVDGVHRAGGRIMPQLWHIGMTRRPGAPPNVGVASVGPSGLTHLGEPLSEPMTESEIADVIDAYARGAADAMRTGFDGVELHGAHGYLIDQFFWEQTNRRTDSWGGGLTARTRFAAEVVRACRRLTAPDFPIVLRFSQWKIEAWRNIRNFDAKLVTTPDELLKFLTPLVDAGVDIFHCSQRRFWEAEFPASALNLAGWAKKLTGKPTITVGLVGVNNDMFATFDGHSTVTDGFERLVEMMDRGDFDLVAVGRPLISDPAWARKVQEGRIDEIGAFDQAHLSTLH